MQLKQTLVLEKSHWHIHPPNRSESHLPYWKSKDYSESFYIIKYYACLIWYVVFKVLEIDMGKWKCLWCSKVLEGESFKDLIAESAKEEDG